MDEAADPGPHVDLDSLDYEELEDFAIERTMTADHRDDELA